MHRPARNRDFTHHRVVPTLEKRLCVSPNLRIIAAGLTDMSSKVPADLRYAKSHEWVRVEGGVATVGITDHAQHELTDVVFVELPAAGRKVSAGETCAVVESVKTASDIYSPVSGEVIEINERLSGTPSLVNDQPYGDGWFYKVRLSQTAEVDSLLSPEAYSKAINS